ncbi:hypothetical protein RJT34_26112 [Clitoria ternatea]|uniref:Piwi domain-containing protein n=1 Tax=Clitoria ternatea TaxID=43366 RepID=A0AAN9IAB5_CLITE
MLLEAHGICDVMTERGEQPDVITYSILMNGYCLNNDVDGARKLFDMMIKSRLVPDVWCYNILIQGYCKTERLDKAMNLFKDMRVNNLVPNIVTYNSLVDGLCKSGRILYAWQLVDEMHFCGQPPPNVTTYNILLQSLCRIEHVDKAIALFRLLISRRSFAPNVWSYNILISSCFKNSRIHEAMILFRDMCFKDLVPNLQTYNMLIDGLYKVGKLKAAQKISQHIRGCDVNVQINVLNELGKDAQTIQHNAYDHDPYAKEFGIKISEKLASVEARILPAPWLKYHESGKEKNCLPQVGHWNMMNKKTINGRTVSRWACINFSRTVQDSVARSFCNELAQMCQEFNPDPIIPIYNTKPEQVEKALKHVYHVSTNRAKEKELELLLAILPDSNGSLYGDLKRICETNLGLISQYCLTKHVFKITKHYLANVSLKINVKMGGRNTVLVDAVSYRIPLDTNYNIGSRCYTS